MNGDVCFLNSKSDWSIKNLGNFGTFVGDTILGLCWFKDDSMKFISGSSKGKIVVGDLDAVKSEFKVAEFPLFEHLTSVHM